MLIKLAQPIIGMDGTYKDSGLVYNTFEGQTYARARVIPTNPKTIDQTKMRTYLTLATRNWENLTAAQRDAWTDYAKTYFPLNSKNLAVRASGIATYARANSIRQVLGLTLTTDAPTEAPPTPVTTIAQVGAEDPDALGITVDHGYSVLTGLQVIVRMTPAMVTVARAPKLTDYRYVRGVDSTSAAALPASGSTVLFSPTRYIVNDGERYGVEVRVIRTADCIMSRPVFGDFLKVV